MVLCSGVGFDVIVTDCIAAHLASALPDAVYLALAVSGGSGFSPGTVKTMLEALASPVRVRRNGRITSIPWGSRTRRIDLGEGERLAMAITWGDVATAWYTTGIPNIEVYVPVSERALQIVRLGRWLAWVLRLPLVRSALTTWIEKSVNGPGERERESRPAWSGARSRMPKVSPVAHSLLRPTAIASRYGARWKPLDIC